MSFAMYSTITCPVKKLVRFASYNNLLLVNHMQAFFILKQDISSKLHDKVCLLINYKNLNTLFLSRNRLFLNTLENLFLIELNCSSKINVKDDLISDFRPILWVLSFILVCLETENLKMLQLACILGWI